MIYVIRDKTDRTSFFTDEEPSGQFNFSSLPKCRKYSSREKAQSVIDWADVCYLRWMRGGNMQGATVEKIDATLIALAATPEPGRKM